jgi:hypothetical protein
MFKLSAGTHLTVIASAVFDICSIPRNSFVPWITSDCHIFGTQPVEFRSCVNRK